MRYFVRCCYNGTAYQGWQRQPHTDMTIQQQLEDAISKVTRVETPITGCGRTDSGVHASEYYFHVNTEFQDIDLLLYKVNQIVSSDIYCSSMKAVHAEAHARFDAVERGYTYYITKERDPFRLETAYHYKQCNDLNVNVLNEAAKLLVGEHDFEAFCKAHTDVTNKLCTVSSSVWVETATGFIFTIRSNRFLRGMIRLVVGMCINVNIGKLDIVEVKTALIKPRRLSLDWSVPGKGLFLDKVSYPPGTVP